MALRVLLLADTHLGFDLPLTPRVKRRRRGPDFLANYRRALAPALAGEVDLVVHGGDVFHRARPHHTLVAMAFEPLRKIADRGIPVFVVPGNHERSRIPHARFASHPLIHVFDRPRTFRLAIRDHEVALLGFPYERRLVRTRMPSLIRQTGWLPGQNDVSLLCVHHCFEGATVGPADFTFRRGPDVIRVRDVPTGVTAVLTGHVHRHQVLDADLFGRPLPAPILYPGSTERTAFAETGEAKGALLLEIGTDDPSTPGLRRRFIPLPTRPMCTADIRAHGVGAADLAHDVRKAVAAVPADAVLRLRIHGHLRKDAMAVLGAAALRALLPTTMNVYIQLVDTPRPRIARRVGHDVGQAHSAERRGAEARGSHPPRRHARAGDLHRLVVVVDDGPAERELTLHLLDEVDALPQVQEDAGGDGKPTEEDRMHDAEDGSRGPVPTAMVRTATTRNPGAAKRERSA
jgi:exonuclease SbcD